MERIERDGVEYLGSPGGPVFDTALVDTVEVEHGYGRQWNFAGKDSTFDLVPAVRLSFGDANSRSVVVISQERWKELTGDERDTRVALLIDDQVSELIERDMRIVEGERERVALQEEIDYLRSTAEQREAKGRTNAAYDIRTQNHALLWTRYDEETNTSTVYVPLDAAIASAQGRGEAEPSGEYPIPQRKSIVDGQEYDDDDGDYVLYLDYVIGVVARESRMVAMQQILDQWTNRENVQRLIELAQEANALMYGNGVRDERKRIWTGVDGLDGHALSGVSYVNEAEVYAVIYPEGRRPMTLGEYLDAVGDSDVILSSGDPS
jgi:hypothetical protein